METLTGNKQIDFLILHKLTDNELGKVCQANKYVNTLCQDNNFWLNRIIYNFKNVNSEEAYKMKNYLGIETFKELYQYLRKLSELVDPSRYSDFSHLNVGKVIDLIKDEKKIDKIIEVNIQVLPKWINRQELIFEMRRNFPQTLFRMSQTYTGTEGTYFAEYIRENIDPFPGRVFINYKDIKSSELLIKKK